VQNSAELAQCKALQIQTADNSCAVQLLAFWKEKKEQFPILSTAAHRILCISAQSEHDFSSVGRTVTEMRSRLCGQSRVAGSLAVRNAARVAVNAAGLQ